MPDANEEIPLTGDPRVDAALERIRGKFQDLEDAMLVQVELERRSSERIREHAGLLADHDTMLAGHEAWMKDHERARREHYEWLEHIQAKLGALTDIVIRRGWSGSTGHALTG
jgi:FtsZ-binding cell division protein ZapB